LKHKLKVNNDIIQDAINIANGVYSPLVGFLHERDYQGVLNDMRLANGQIWPIPIVIQISQSDYNNLKDEKEVILVDKSGQEKVRLENIEVYTFNEKEYAEKIYGTTNQGHPGVAEIFKGGDYLLGGKVIWVDDSEVNFKKYNFTPKETKKIFKQKNWQTVVAFQTRNVPHCGHEFLQKQALEQVDGLFIQPVIGPKKLADFKDEYIIGAYEVLINKYYPKDKVLLGVLPFKMRYAGPREALMHALIRKNYGCTHFIVGRDHAGIDNFYSPEAAQEIFNRFNQDELRIKVLKFEEVVYDKNKKEHCFAGQCPKKNREKFSGTDLRRCIIEKKQPSEYIIRPEIFNFLSFSYELLVDNLYQNGNGHKGFTVWFTGLSGAGKTTIADKIYEELKKRGIKVERLDGDVVREQLTKDLGFSKEDRDENIRRIGSVAKLLTHNGIGVIASFISPYKKIRRELKDKINNFIEIYVDAPIEVCEERDIKGIYKKARAGEIKNFTGISDPYEAPQNPEIYLKTDQMSVEESVEKVIKYLEKKKLI